MAIGWSNLSIAGWQFNAYIWFISATEWAQWYVENINSSLIYLFICLWHIQCAARQNSINRKKMWNDIRLLWLKFHVIKNMRFLLPENETSGQATEKWDRHLFTFTFYLRWSILFSIEHARNKWWFFQISSNCFCHTFFNNFIDFSLIYFLNNIFSLSSI